MERITQVANTPLEHIDESLSERPSRCRSKQAHFFQERAFFTLTFDGAMDILELTIVLVQEIFMSDEKLTFLRQSHSLHPHPEEVRDPLFTSGSPFFDPCDLVQVKKEEHHGRKCVQSGRAGRHQHRIVRQGGSSRNRGGITDVARPARRSYYRAGCPYRGKDLDVPGEARAFIQVRGRCLTNSLYFIEMMANWPSSAASNPTEVDIVIASYDRG